MLSYIKYNLFFSIYTFQNVLLNKIITVNISNLPKSIQKEISHFADDGKWPHESVGPTEPKEGPIFPIDDAAAVKDVSISNPSIENISAEATKIKI